MAAAGAEETPAMSGQFGWEASGRLGSVPAVAIFIAATFTISLALPLSLSARPQSEVAPATAPQPQSTAQTPPAQTAKPADALPDKPLPQPAPQKNDRLFYVLPNNLTVEDEAMVPALTAKGKFKLVAKNAFDPAVFPFIGFIALVGQGSNSEPSFGQGAAGYGKRYGVAFGDSTVGSFMTGAIFPSLLRQDPRYYQLVNGGLKKRAIYSVGRIFITRTDSGHNQFNSSEVVGNLVAASLSNAYHPVQDRSFANTMSEWGTGTMWDAMANLAEEFWPDIHRMIKQKFTRAPEQ
jgi:hypothetical protein